jgi:hypothetical protein
MSDQQDNRILPSWEHVRSLKGVWKGYQMFLLHQVILNAIRSSNQLFLRM